MSDHHIARLTGAGALACVVLSWLQFPLWMVGAPPSPYDGDGLIGHLSAIRVIALVRVLMAVSYTHLTLPTNREV